MLMSQAKIYWDLDNYAQVEKVNDKSALFLEILVGLLKNPQLPIRPFAYISSVTTHIISKLINNRTIVCKLKYPWVFFADI